MPDKSNPLRSVALVTLGCARNDVDSEELAGRLAASGWSLVDDPAEADVAVVNTCGFIEQAKKDSIDVLLELAELRDDGGARTRAVVAVGCMAQRYGLELEETLPEADAVLGFDSYAELSSHLETILHGGKVASHVPRDRRELLPLAPSERQADPQAGLFRQRLDSGPWAPLKLASGCDRRCTFCAIPMFRGAFVSRPPEQVLSEAKWLAAQGVREVFLVSENTTSYGKDLGDVRLLERLLPQLADVEGLSRVRVSYLQPAEVRPGLIEVIAGTPGVVPYFDLSFQHCAPGVLRRMRRFGSAESFLELIAKVRALAPEAGIRSNVIVGFPGETDEDLAELEGFLTAARLDVVGVFGYSDEDGTEAVGLGGKLHATEVASRVERVSALVDELVDQRAEDRIGTTVEVLLETCDDEEPGVWLGRAAHQGPEVDGVTRLEGLVGAGAGRMVTALVVGSEGPDLVVRP